MNEDLNRYRVGVDDQIEDVDLEVEQVHLAGGRRLTNELAEQIARGFAVATRGGETAPGAPSLLAATSEDLPAEVDAELLFK